MIYLLERMYDELQLNPANTHIIGFSLGAHLAGLVGEGLQNKQKMIGRITGMYEIYSILGIQLDMRLYPLR